MKKLFVYFLMLMFIASIFLVGGSRVKAQEQILKAPVVEKIDLQANYPGHNDQAVGMAGSVSANSLVEVFANKNFDHPFASIVAKNDGSFGPLSLGDNAASVFYLRFKTSYLTSSLVTIKNDIEAPILSETGSLKEKFYQETQKISYDIVCAENITGYAEIGNLDSNFPERVSLVKTTDATWNFVTPKLSNRLKPGSHNIKIVALDQAGNIRVKYFPVHLSLLPTPKVLKAAIDVNNNAYLAWRLVKPTENYLVNWSDEKGLVGQKEVSYLYSSTVITNLKPGTLYKFTIISLRPDKSESLSESIALKTFGAKVAEPQITKKASVESSEVIASAIGGGVTSEAKVAEKKNEENVKTTTTESPVTGAQEQNGGWNRLLVALSILIIAAGVAVGGYYGYEWIIQKKESNPTDERW